MAIRVRITGIRQDDLFYKYRKDIIGTIIDLELEDEMNVDGTQWTSTIMNKELFSTDPKNYSGFAFKAIHFEPA